MKIVAECDYLLLFYHWSCLWSITVSLLYLECFTIVIMIVFVEQKSCSKCKELNDRPRQRYCRSCHNAYMRSWRPPHAELTPEERQRSSTRAYANVYQRRGHLIPQPCQICGSTENIEKHHEDYSKPLDVIWLCRIHHKHGHKKGPEFPEKFPSPFISIEIGGTPTSAQTDNSDAQGAP